MNRVVYELSREKKVEAGNGVYSCMYSSEPAKGIVRHPRVVW